MLGAVSSLGWAHHTALSRGEPVTRKFAPTTPATTPSARKSFENMDIIYSMVWYDGKLHVGTFAEDIPGSAEIWPLRRTRLDGDHR